jgi:hypothetical protein
MFEKLAEQLGTLSVYAPLELGPMPSWAAISFQAFLFVHWNQNKQLLDILNKEETLLLYF